NNIVMRYGAFVALKGINVRINDGEFVVIVGPSGCGKSSLLRAIAGLEKITSGEIVLAGQPIHHMPSSKRGLAMVFQNYALYPQKTVAQNMGFALLMAKTPKPEIERRVSEAAKILQIENLLSRKPGELSGGQRQRVAIGRAIVREPKVFLFDEPLSNLDASLRVDMRIELAKLHKSLNATMIYVTHDQVEAMTLADRVIVLNGGEIAQVGAPMDLYDNPRNKFVAGFIGSPKMNFIPGQFGIDDKTPTNAAICQGTLSVELPKLATMPDRGADITLGIRPEHIKLEDADYSTPMDVTVSLVEHLGEESIIYSQMKDGSSIVIKSSSPVYFSDNQQIKIHLPTDKMHVFDTHDDAIAMSGARRGN
ncbi:MAG: sn-glycerol-3-phosphate ABC transporter ATP-binding protein UgpC, partial [Rhodobacteraceae bacterium]|nr:sn-glycerol-3-phosphate ABC transporter ATP-binding protein UgpC [Paracoccaceae bacterium]